MPQLEGYEIAAWNQPADQTGGDYYDWQLLPGWQRVVVGAGGCLRVTGIGPALLAAVFVEPTPGLSSRRRNGAGDRHE